MNNTRNILQDDITPKNIPDVMFIGNAVVQLMASVLSTFGNSLVLISVIQLTYLRSTAHVFVVMLACFDLGMGLFGFVSKYVFLSSVFYSAIKSTSILCKILDIIQSSMRTGDLMSAMFLAVDRLIFITYSLRYPDFMTYKTAAIAIGFTILCCPISSIVTISTNKKSKEGIGCDVPKMMDSDVAL